MNAQDILSDVQLIDLDHREAQFVRAELTEKITAAIAAAVAAERDRARKIEVALQSLVDDIVNFPGEFDRDSEAVIEAQTALAEYDAAAIRARGEGGKE